jgi:integrase
VSERERLTEKLVHGLPAPPSGSQIYWDAPDERGKGHVPGFGLRVTAGGVRAYVLNYTTHTGRGRRYTIGRAAVWTLTAARQEAADLKRRVDQGEDPLRDIEEKRASPTVSELCDVFLTEHVATRRPATQKQYRALVMRIRQAIGGAKVGEIRFGDADHLHRKISDQSGPYMANRLLAVLSKMFSLAIRKGWRTDNPAKGVERNQEHERERYLSAAELARLLEALGNAKDRQAAALFSLCLLTGCRIGEALNARWDQFDLDVGRWTKPASTTKQKKLHVVPLSPQAVELLETLEVRGDLLFPCRGKYQNSWTAICNAAGIKSLRVHDLRHSYASALVSDGVSLPIVGKLLGHAKASTTSRYAHLADSPLREATNRVGNLVANARKVAPLRGGRQ